MTSLSSGTYCSQGEKSDFLIVVCLRIIRYLLRLACGLVLGHTIVYVDVDLFLFVLLVSERVFNLRIHAFRSGKFSASVSSDYCSSDISSFLLELLLAGRECL